MICGVNVEAGKTVELAPLQFAATMTPARANNSDAMTIKGKVVGSGGAAMNRSSIYYQTNGSSTGTSVNTDGNFQLHVGGMGAGGVIRVKVPGFKQAEVDCSAPGLDLNNLEIKLERITYGSAALKIVDEEGRPVSGAIAEPVSTPNNNYYSYNQRMKNSKKTSDAFGAVRFSGLSTGMRRFTINKDGYYLTEPVRIGILPDVDATATVMMRKGLTVSGKLSVAAGTAPKQAVVSMRRARDSAVFQVGVNDAGEFSISGLPPDKYMLRADAPMMATAVEREVEVSAESKSGADLELVRKGGFAVQLDKALVGRALWLVRKDAVDRSKKNPGASSMGSYQSAGSVDADGKAEFWNVTPGEYRISITAQQAAQTSMTERLEKDTEGFLRRVDCGRVSELFEIKEPKLFRN